MSRPILIAPYRATLDKIGGRVGKNPNARRLLIVPNPVGEGALLGVEVGPVCVFHKISNITPDKKRAMPYVQFKALKGQMNTLVGDTLESAFIDGGTVRADMMPVQNMVSEADMIAVQMQRGTILTSDASMLTIRLDDLKAMLSAVGADRRGLVTLKVWPDPEMADSGGGVERLEIFGEGYAMYSARRSEYRGMPPADNPLLKRIGD